MKGKSISQGLSLMSGSWIEIGPKDLKGKQVVLVRRDDGKKENVAVKDLKKRVWDVLTDIQRGLLKKAEKKLSGAIVNCRALGEVKKAVNGKKIAFAPLCGKRECEDNLKSETGGAKVLNIPFKQPKGGGKCVGCGGKVEYWGYVGKSY